MSLQDVILPVVLESPWRILKADPGKFAALSDLGTSLSISDPALQTAEKLVCAAYTGHDNGYDINELRYNLISKRFAKAENLPPTKDSLVQHIYRVNYQTLVWKQALEGLAAIPSPVGHGWEEDGQSVKAILMTKECASKSLVLVVSCNCRKQPCTGRCSCSKETIHCISACGCGAEEDCKNPYKVLDATCSSTDTGSSESESNESSDEDCNAKKNIRVAQTLAE